MCTNETQPKTLKWWKFGSTMNSCWWGGQPTISSCRKQIYEVICNNDSFNPQTSRNICTKCQVSCSLNKSSISPFSGDTVLMMAIGLCELLHYTLVLTKFFEFDGSIFTSLIRMQNFDWFSKLCFDSTQKLLTQHTKHVRRVGPVFANLSYYKVA